jgi:hypothetical protein
MPLLPASTRVVALSFCLLAAMASGSPAQEPAAPDFDLRIVTSTAGFIGDPLTIHPFEADVFVTSRPTPQSGNLAAQAWSLSIRTSSGGDILEATHEGTAADDPPDGVFDTGAGFRLVELTTGPGNVGVISAVILSLVRPVTLPANGQSKLLHLRGQCQVPGPTANCNLFRMEFHDGLVGSGTPSGNALIVQSRIREDNGGARDNDRDAEEDGLVVCCRNAPFIRGDCASDRQINITDPIVALNFLFLGGDEPNCLNACDTNDDNLLNITDPIVLLSFLFLGGPPPAPPREACAIDPTPSLLGCGQAAGCP